MADAVRIAHQISSPTYIKEGLLCAVTPAEPRMCIAPIIGVYAHAIDETDVHSTATGTDGDNELEGDTNATPATTCTANDAGKKQGCEQSKEDVQELLSVCCGDWPEYTELKDELDKMWDQNQQRNALLWAKVSHLRKECAKLRQIIYRLEHHVVDP